MRYTLKLSDVIIGYSELEDRDPILGMASGVFRPGFGYELVQPVFRLFSESTPMPGGEPLDEPKLERYHAARDRLGLGLYDDAGERVRTSAIHIADYLEEGKGIRIEVLSHDLV